MALRFAASGTCSAIAASTDRRRASASTSWTYSSCILTSLLVRMISRIWSTTRTISRAGFPFGPNTASSLRRIATSVLRSTATSGPRSFACAAVSDSNSINICRSVSSATHRLYPFTEPAGRSSIIWSSHLRSLKVPTQLHQAFPLGVCNLDPTNGLHAKSLT